MQTFRVELGARSHPVFVGAGILGQLGQLAIDAGIRAGRVAVVTDSNVEKPYGLPALSALNKAGFSAELVTIAAGEASKSAHVLEGIYDRLIAADYLLLA